METCLLSTIFKKIRLRQAFAPPAWRSPGDRPFQEMPLLAIMAGAMPVLTKNSGYATAKET